MKLYPYQEEAAQKAFKNKKFALFMEMGLGKTITALRFLDLIYRIKDINVLIVAPIQVCNNTWPVEIENTRSTFFNILPNLFSLTGNLEDRKLLLSTYKSLKKGVRLIDGLASDLRICIINKEKIDWLNEEIKLEIKNNTFKFDVVIIDESSFFKNSSTNRYKALYPIIRAAEYSLLLSGTPISNSLLDIWAQIKLLDEGKRLFPSFNTFKMTYFTSDYMGYRWTPKMDSNEKIMRKIEDIICIKRSKDFLDLPPLIHNKIYCTLSNAGYKQYKKLEKEFLIEIENSTITAPSAAVLSNKLKQYCAGGIYTDECLSKNIPTQKIDILNEILEINEKQNVLVAYNYGFEKKRLLEEFPDAISIKEKNAMERWNAGEIRILIAHPLNAAYGLNLQKGGHIIVWYSLPWSLDQYQQFNARLHRQGQNETTIIHHLLVAYTIEERVFDCLTTKEVNQYGFMNALSIKFLDKDRKISQ